MNKILSETIDIRVVYRDLLPRLFVVLSCQREKQFQYDGVKPCIALVKPGFIYLLRFKREDSGNEVLPRKLRSISIPRETSNLSLLPR